MTGFRLHFPFALCGLSLVLLLCHGCSENDPTDPSSEPSTWVEETLPSGLTSTVLYDLAVQGSYAVAVGGRFGGGEFVAVALERTDEGWRPLSLPGLPTGSILTGVVLTGGGVPVAVGAALKAGGRAQPLIVDLRQDPAVILLETEGFATLNAVAVGGETVLAVGLGDGGFAARSVGGAPWVVEALPAGGTAEFGMNDIEYDSGRFLVCGFDDRGPPYAVILASEADQWSSWGVPGRNVEPRSVLGLPDGSILTGGRQADDSGGDDLAFLKSYAPDIEEWTTLVLPESQRLGSVEDLHRSPDGSWTAVLHGPMGAIVRDGVTEYEFVGGLFGVAEDGSGRQYAVGFAGSLEANPRAVILVRDP